ncbi:MAG: hypothetical protein IPM35_38620 [Myxococcales bacterium]|nr:hypothetical protein [Myxococcales bacterium]
MRRAILSTFIVLTVFPACYRKAKQQEQSAVEEFTAPAPPGQEEKWVAPEPKEEPKPEPPPPPPEPTSPPPEEGLGYNFGQDKNATMLKCTKRGTWGKRGGAYTCSRPVDGAAIPGKPVLSFCDEKLCAVGVAVVVETPDHAAWSARFEEMKAALVAKHGAPTVDAITVPDTCKNETFVKCLDDGSANAEATWNWKDGHRVTLTMSKKKSDDGPSAIRFVSIVNG